MRAASSGSTTMVCRHMPPAPGCHAGGEDAVRVGGRALEVVQLPAAEQRPGDVPVGPLAVSSENEGALARSHQDPYSAHSVPPVVAGRSRYAASMAPVPFIVPTTGPA